MYTRKQALRTRSCVLQKDSSEQAVSKQLASSYKQTTIFGHIERLSAAKNGINKTPIIVDIILRMNPSSFIILFPINF